MKRRNFLFASLLAIPLPSLAKFKSFERSKKGVFVKSGETCFGGDVKAESFDKIFCKVSEKDTDGDFSMFYKQADGSANGGPPLHLHFNQDEVFYVIEGEFLIQVGEEKFHAKAGDTVFAPRQVPHAFINIGKSPFKMINTFQPAGNMEDFFKKVNALTNPLSKDEMNRLFEDHGMKLLGERLKAE
jgi:mannose-6-phosphate isomerase-like protein (cupin superfamily)